MRITIDKLRRLRDDWYAYWSYNIQTAVAQRDFVTFGNQYTEREIRDYRAIDINPIVDNITKIKSNNLLDIVRGKRFDLELKINGDSPDLEVIIGLQRALTNIIFDTESSIQYNDVLKNSIISGYGALYIGFGYSNEDIEDPEFSIKIRSLNKLNSFFFDPHAQEPHKGDGRYCGIIHTLYKQNMDKYPRNVVDSISFEDQDTFPWTKITDLYLKRKSGIWLYRFTDEVLLEERELNGVTNFPVIFHGGCSEFIEDSQFQDGREITRPPSVDAYYSQRAINMAKSMMDFHARNYLPRFLMPQASVPEAHQSPYGDLRQRLLTYIPLDKETAMPIVLPAQDSSKDLPYIIESSRATIEQFYSDAGGIIQDSKYSSAKAMDRKLAESNRGGVSAYYAAHRTFLNRVGTVLLSLLPYQISAEKEIIYFYLDLTKRANVAIKMSESLEKQRERDNELILSIIQYIGSSNLGSPQISLELIGEVLNNIDTVEAKELRKRLMQLGEQLQIQQAQEQQQPTGEQVKILELQIKKEVEDIKAQLTIMTEQNALLRELIRNQHEIQLARMKNDTKNV